MKKAFLVLGYWLLIAGLHAQTVKEKLQKAYQQFESDTQLRHATSSLYVINAKTGEIAFDKNSQVGLAPASTQKIITAATAFELLGRDFRYETKFGYLGKIKDNVLFGNFYVKSAGDPTFGSWRWINTSDSTIAEKIKTAVRKLNIRGYTGLSVDGSGWDDEAIPDGWIWQDIGNYYGAGSGGFNWRENQYDIVLRSGSRIGDPVGIVRKYPEVSTTTLISEVKSAAKGTGDNAYVYYPLHDFRGVIRGTIPIDENAFTISSASPNPAHEFESFLTWEIFSKMKIGQVHFEGRLNDTTILFSHYSPSLDSIIYWFLKRSINLYGEGLIKTLAYKKMGFASTDTGVAIVKDFWKQKGLDPEELNIKDGSGLSPQNRVTTHVQVEVLKFAKKQSWFPYFFDALPEYNNMKMKSGTISDVKSFCGYHTSGDGTQYIFSFLVNNYTGSSSSVVQKMYKVLDVLK